MSLKEELAWFLGDERVRYLLGVDGLPHKVKFDPENYATVTIGEEEPRTYRSRGKLVTRSEWIRAIWGQPGKVALCGADGCDGHGDPVAPSPSEPITSGIEYLKERERSMHTKSCGVRKGEEYCTCTVK